MAIEYLYNAIRASAGEEVCVCAEAFDEEGAAITENCSLLIHDDTGTLWRGNGTYADDCWSFTIPAEVTENLKGRYWYCIRHNETRLCFKQPIYFV